MELAITTHPSAERYLIVVEGEIDISNADKLRNAIDLALEQPTERVVLDFSRAPHIASTGIGVPVIDRHALGDLISEEETATLPHIAYCSVGNADGTLPLLRCEAITVDEIKLGSRAVALAEHPLGDGGAYAGLWCEGCERGEKHGELAQNAVV